MHRADDPNVKKKKEEQLYPSTHTICLQISITLIQDGRQEPFNHPPFQFLCGGDFLFWFCVASSSLSTLLQFTLRTSPKNVVKITEDLISHLKGVPLACNQEKENYSLFFKSQCSYFVIYKHTNLKNLIQYKTISS